MTEEELDELMIKELRAYDRHNWRMAFVAIWLPKLAPKECGRCEEWNFFKAIWCTLALCFGRQRKASQYDSCDIAYWSESHYGYGWSAICVSLYSGCRYEIYSDGDTYL